MAIGSPTAIGLPKAGGPLFRWVVVAAILAGVAPCATVAATLPVTDCGDTTPGGAPGQLRRLINDAAPGDTIVVPACTITLTGAAGDDANAGGDLDILKDLTIQGTGPNTILDGANLDRIFEVHVGVTANISALVVQGGDFFGSGGGISNHGMLQLTSVTVTDNTSVFGGGVFNDGTMTITGSIVSLNGTGGFSAGIENMGVLTLTGSAVRQNFSAFGIGGVGNYGTLTVTDSIISNNLAQSGGFGGGLGNYGTATLERSTVSGNIASSGGGIYNANTLALVNVTVSTNGATGDSGVGGGVYNAGGASATLTNVTVTRNGTGPFGSGTGIRNEGALTLSDTIVASNTCSGTVTSAGHNLDSGTSCGFAGPGDLSGVDPLLGVLTDNGGPTPTHALIFGSPAIDGGDNAVCPPTDQRGVPRPQGPACDIGAYELPGMTSFFTLSPCRVADTRFSEGPVLTANTTRDFSVGGRCGIPSDAVAVAIIVTTTAQTDLGDLRLYPTSGVVPGASTINFAVNHVRANNATIPLGSGGQIAAQCDMPLGSTGTTHFIMDVFGYFR